MLLFGAMGVARWLLVRGEDAAAIWPAESVSVLAVLCLLYPIYTAGLRDLAAGLSGNALTAVVAVAVCVYVGKYSRRAAWCLAPVCVWLFYAGAATAYAVLRG